MNADSQIKEVVCDFDSAERRRIMIRVFLRGIGA
jgi:hypothetical protein